MLGSRSPGGSGRSLVLQLVIGAMTLATILLLAACGTAATTAPIPTPLAATSAPEPLPVAKKITTLTADLEIVIGEPPEDTAELAGQFIYILKVTNQGPQPASMVRVSVGGSSPEVSYVSQDRRCAVTEEGVLGCELASMLPDDVREIEITGLVVGQPGLIINTVTVENVNGLDPDTSNNSVSQETLWVGTQSDPTSTNHWHKPWRPLRRRRLQPHRQPLPPQ
jgi:hypothetical protein